MQAHYAARSLTTRRSCMYEFRRASNPTCRASDIRCGVRLVSANEASRFSAAGFIRQPDQCGRKYFRAVACALFYFAEGAKLGSFKSAIGPAE
jgi:hypothetical protein